MTRQIERSNAYQTAFLCMIVPHFFIYFIRLMSTLQRYQRHEWDTGSPEFQIWVLGSKIKILQDHLKENHKDYPAKRALLKFVQERRQHLKYLKAKALEKYLVVSKKIWLKV